MFGDENELEQQEQDTSQDTPGGDDKATPPAADPPAEQMIPKKRFDQVYAQAKSWEKFGKPEDVERDLNEYRQWKQQVEQYRKQQAALQNTPEAQRERLRAQLEDVDPRLKKLDMIDQIQSQVVQIYAEKASNHLGQLLAQNNLKVGAKTQERLEDYLLASMTDEQRTRMYAGDVSVVDEVFKAELETEDGLLASLKSRAQQSEPPPTPVRAKPGTSTTPAKAPDPNKKKSFDDYVTEAWERYRKT